MAFPGHSGTGEWDFDGIVILGSINYESILHSLAGPKIKVIAEKELTAKSIIEAVRKEKAKCVGKTLWILPTGIFSICDYGDHPECKSRYCRHPLVQLQMNNQPSEVEIAEEVQEILFHTNKICTSIQYELESTGKILIVPPIPAIVVQEANFRSHSEVHRICARYHTSSADNSTLFRLHIFYNILCDAWSSLATEWLPFGDKTLFSEFQSAHRGKNLVSINEDKSYDHALDGWLSMVRELAKLAGVNIYEESNVNPRSSPQSTVGNLMTGIRHSEREDRSKQDLSSADKFVNDDTKTFAYKFDHCVIVGVSSFLSKLENVVKDMPVTLLERTFDLGKDSLDMLRNEQKNYSKKTIWIFVRGVSEIAYNTELCSECESAECEDPYYAFILKNKPGGHPSFKSLNVSEMIDRVIREATDFIIDSEKYVEKDSKVFLAPLIPASAYNGSLKSSFTHNELHDLSYSDPKTPILSGSVREWKNAVQELDKKWMQMVLKNVDIDSTEYTILKNLVKPLSSLLNFSSARGENRMVVNTQRIWCNNLEKFIDFMLRKKIDVTPARVSQSPQRTLPSNSEIAAEMKTMSPGSANSCMELSSWSTNVAKKVIKPKKETPAQRAARLESCTLVVRKVNSEIQQDHIKQILDACGTVMNATYPDEHNPGILKVLYNNEKSAQRAVRVLNFFKVLGKASNAEMANSTVTAPTSELQPEDRMVVPIIQDVIVQMQKAKVASKPTQVSIVAKTQVVATAAEPAKEDLVKKTDYSVGLINALKPQPKAKPEDPSISICVSNLSSFVPVNIIKEAVRALGIIPEDGLRNNQFSCKVGSVSDAIQMVIQLNDYRLPDTKLRVSPEQVLDFRSAHVTAKEELKDQINQIFKQNSDVIVNNLREPFCNDINIYTYKTQVCNTVNCNSPSTCLNFHNINDRRRNPLNTEYSSSMCSKYKCKDSQTCRSSHTKSEQEFHVTIYKKNICKSAAQTGSCNSKGICSDAHPETSDMFFNKSWEDLFVEGLGETFVFLNGVIKNMFKLGNTTGLTVLVLTSSDEMVYLLQQTFVIIGKSCRQNVVAVSQYGSVSNEGTIMISTPKGLSKLFKRIELSYDFTRIQAMIIDDGLKTLSLAMQAKDEKLSALIAKPCTNKVVINDKITEDKVRMAAELLKTTFKTLPAGRPKNKWIPLVKADTNRNEQQDLQALASLFKVESNVPPEENSEPVFKVPFLPVAKPRGRSANRANKWKEGNTSGNESTTRHGGQDPGGEKSSNALQQLMSNYKDFHKAGEKEALTSQPGPSSGFGTVKDSTSHKSSKSRNSGHLSPPNNVGKKLPYYSAKEMNKIYASIPFKYDDGSSVSSTYPGSNGKTEDGKVPSSVDTKSRESSKDESSSQESSLSRAQRKSRWSSEDEVDIMTQALAKIQSIKKSSSQSSSKSVSQSSSKSSQSSSKSSQSSSKSSSQSSSKSSSRSSSMSSSSSSSKRRRSPSPPRRSRDKDRKSYIEAELDLKEDHIKETKFFLNNPEMHAEYENKYNKFSERYNKQNPGKHDKKHKDERWKEFWKVILTGLQDTQWQCKTDMLKKQFNMEDFNRKESKGKDTVLQSKRTYSDSFGDQAEEKSRKSSRKDHSSDDQTTSNNRRSRRGDRSRRNSPRDRDKHESSGSFSMTRALNSIKQVYHLLGVLSPAMKIVLESINKVGINSREAVNILLENDNALLVEMACKRFEELVKTTSNPQQNANLMDAAKQVKKLQEFSAKKLKEAAKAAADNVISSRKKSSRSRSSSGKATSDSIERDSGPKLVNGLDVNKIARATYEKGTEATIEFIKNAFEYEGINNSGASDINDVYVEVSRIHFQMNLENSSESDPSYESRQHFQSSQTRGFNSRNDDLNFSPDIHNEGYGNRPPPFNALHTDDRAFGSQRNDGNSAQPHLMGGDQLNELFPSSIDNFDPRRNEKNISFRNSGYAPGNDRFNDHRNEVDSFRDKDRFDPCRNEGDSFRGNNSFPPGNERFNPRRNEGEKYPIRDDRSFLSEFPDGPQGFHHPSRPFNDSFETSRNQNSFQPNPTFPQEENLPDYQKAHEFRRRDSRNIGPGNDRVPNDCQNWSSFQQQRFSDRDNFRDFGNNRDNFRDFGDIRDHIRDFGDNRDNVNQRPNPPLQGSGEQDDNDGETIDFMNQRLDQLLQDARFHNAGQSHQQPEGEGSRGGGPHRERFEGGEPHRGQFEGEDPRGGGPHQGQFEGGPKGGGSHRGQFGRQGPRGGGPHQGQFMDGRNFETNNMDMNFNNHKHYSDDFHNRQGNVGELGHENHQGNMQFENQDIRNFGNRNMNNFGRDNNQNNQRNQQRGRWNSNRQHFGNQNRNFDPGNDWAHGMDMDPMRNREGFHGPPEGYHGDGPQGNWGNEQFSNQDHEEGHDHPGNKTDIGSIESFLNRFR